MSKEINDTNTIFVESLQKMNQNEKDKLLQDLAHAKKDQQMSDDVYQSQIQALLNNGANPESNLGGALMVFQGINAVFYAIACQNGLALEVFGKNDIAIASVKLRTSEINEAKKVLISVLLGKNDYLYKIEDTALFMQEFSKWNTKLKFEQNHIESMLSNLLEKATVSKDEKLKGSIDKMQAFLSGARKNTQSTYSLARKIIYKK